MMLHRTALSICCAMLIVVGAFAGENLVKNPGFEIDQNADGLPDGWTFGWKATHSGEPASHPNKQEPKWGRVTEAHSGNYAVMCAVARAYDDGVWKQDGLPAKPGCTVYKVSAWIKVENCQGGDARVCVVYIGKDHKWLGADYRAIRVAKNQDWTHHTALVSPPPGTVELRLRLWANMSYTGPITVWFDDISLEPTSLSEIPPVGHRDETPPPELTAAEKARGFVLFRREYTDMLMPTSVPRRDDIGAELRAYAARGETEPLSFGIWPTRQLAGATIAVSDLRGPGGATIPASAIETRVALCLERMMHFTDKRRQVVPVVLEKRRAVDLNPRQSVWVWLIVHVPERARPGLYRGRVEVAAAGKAAALPIALRVYDVTLPQPRGIAFGMYDRPQGYYEGLSGLEEKWRDQRQHGMTTVGLCCPFGGEMKLDDGRVTADVAGSLLAQSVEAYRRVGFPEPLLWLMGSDVSRFARKAGPLGSPEYTRTYAAVVRAIVEYGRSHGWPEIIFQPVDEAFEARKRWDQMVADLKAIKTVPGVRTEEDGMNSNPDGLDDTWHLIDVLNIHYGPFPARNVWAWDEWLKFKKRAERDGKLIWFYNLDVTGYHPEASRFGYGFHLFRSGATGMFTWCYQTVYKDPYALHWPRFTFLHRYPAGDGHLGGPTTGWEAIRQGVEEYRLCLAWRQACQRALRRGGQAAQIARDSRRFVQRLFDRVDYSKWLWRSVQGEWTGGFVTDEAGRELAVGHFKIPNGWSFEDYERLRRHMLQTIERLK